MYRADPSGQLKSTLKQKYLPQNVVILTFFIGKTIFFYNFYLQNNATKEEQLPLEMYVGED